jgi:hypothetical protein
VKTPKSLKFPQRTNKQSLSRKYFVENFMDTVNELVGSQLDSGISFIAKPGETPETFQITLKNYLTNWYKEYMRHEIGDRLNNLANGIFTEMQKQWDKGVYNESLMRDLGEATWVYLHAPDLDPDPDPRQAQNNTETSAPDPKQAQNNTETSSIYDVEPDYDPKRFRYIPVPDTEKTEEIKKIMIFVIGCIFVATGFWMYFT